MDIIEEQENINHKRKSNSAGEEVARKKRKVLDHSDIVWGMEVRPVDEMKAAFLNSGLPVAVAKQRFQSKIIMVEASQIAARTMLREVLNKVMEVAMMYEMERTTLSEVQACNNLFEKEGEIAWDIPETKTESRERRKKEKDEVKERKTAEKLWKELDAADRKNEKERKAKEKKEKVQKEKQTSASMGMKKMTTFFKTTPRPASSAHANDVEMEDLEVEDMD